MKFPPPAFAKILLAALCVAATAFAQPRIITTAIEVRSLSLAEAERGIPVEIRGVVILIEGESAIFVQDDTSTTFFRIRKLPPLQPGDEIEVRGKTRMGLFLPGIDYAEIKVVGRRALPPGIPAGYDDLVFGRYHYQRVAVEGIVRSVSPLDARKSLIRLAMGSRVIEVRVDQTPDPARSLIDHRVRITGLAAGFINERRQLVHAYVQVLNWNEIEVLAPSPPASDVAMISAEDLLAFRVTGYGEQRIGIDGVVTARFSGDEVYLRQGNTGFAVRLGAAATVKPGDVVAVVGFPEMDRFSAWVVDAELMRQEAGPAPLPLEVESLDELNGTFDSHLVSVPARVRDAFKSDGGTTLLLTGRNGTVQARLPEGVEAPAIGSQLRITGICRVESAAFANGFSSRAGTVSLRARSAADLMVLQKPSWWTARRLGIGLASLVGITVLAGLWITLLRGQVRRQTRALRRRIEAEAALEERQRIAREFHDTLEQELAGVSLRLDALATREMDDKGRNLISASRNLVSRIQTETRDLIRDLRDAAETAGDLTSALEGVASRHAAESGVAVRVEAPVKLPTLPAATVHDLRMIARESISNALKHGAATEVVVQATLEGSDLVLRVIDNGRGFNPATALQDRRGHFGCAGMRERARKIGADVSWNSTPASGTTVIVKLPARPEENPPPGVEAGLPSGSEAKYVVL